MKNKNRSKAVLEGLKGVVVRKMCIGQVKPDVKKGVPYFTSGCRLTYNGGQHFGFTLIELLVVVLIIGILASIALPQYRKAVFKSQAAEAFTNLKTMKNALDVCELANGRVSDNNEYCRTVENLDVKIGEVTAAGGTDSFYTDKFRYTVDRGGITAQPNIAVSALMRGNPYEVCICLYDDGHFSTYNNMDNCVNEHYPNFNIAKTLNISEDANCVCC